MQGQVLGATSRWVLEQIAQGRSYAQIVESRAGLTYLDIFRAAREALDRLPATASYDQRLAVVKRANPRAYERWTPEEDAALIDMADQGAALAVMADTLERQPSAIRSRLEKLRGIGQTQQHSEPVA